METTIAEEFETKTDLVRPDVRNYAEAQNFLRDYWSWKRSKIPGFSIRRWSQRMGFKNHSLLSRILAGHRPLSPSHLSKVSAGLDLRPEEQTYFDLLVNLQSAKTNTEREIYENKLKSFNVRKKTVFKDLESFRLMSNWVHTAILEMTALKDFSSDPAWISSRLEEKVPVADIKMAIQRLKDLGLLKDESGTLVKQESNIHFGSRHASEAVREYHKQVIKLAYKSIENQNHLERILHSFSFTVDSTKISKAEKIITEFKRRLEEELESPTGDITYQCNIQLFRLTKKRKETSK